MIAELRPLRATLKVLEAHPWVVAGFFASVVAIKVLVVAEGDIATAGLILGSGGFAGLASVILLTIVPTACTAAFVVLGAITGGVFGAKGFTQGLLPLFVAAVLAIVTAILIPAQVSVWVFGITVAFAFALGGWNWWVTRNDPNATAQFGGGGRSEFVLFIIVTIPLSLWASAWSPTFWLPVEHFTVETVDPVDPTETNTYTYLGYILTSESDYTTILREDDRRTETFPSTELVDRQRCDLELAGSPLLPFLGTPKGYGSCDDIAIFSSEAGD